MGVPSTYCGDVHYVLYGSNSDKWGAAMSYLKWPMGQACAGPIGKDLFHTNAKIMPPEAVHGALEG